MYNSPEEFSPSTGSLQPFHRYAQFVDASEMVCLHDSRGVVVSLPPLTNSDQSKVLFVLFSLCFRSLCLYLFYF